MPAPRRAPHCVGYNLLSQKLDGVPMLQLEGHRGELVELEVLATFLPRLALDALQAALRAAGLSAASLTLEPIAAVQLAVPPELRPLEPGLHRHRGRHLRHRPDP